MSKHRVRRRTRHTPAPKPQPSFTDETRAAAWAGCTELADELQVLDGYLEPTHEGPPLSQMSADTNTRVSELMARERAERFGYGRKTAGPRDPWGLDIIYPIGASQAPARMATLDASTHIHTELIALEGRISKALQICPIRSSELASATRTLRIRSWLYLVHSAELLTDIERSVDGLLRAAERAIDGDPAAKLNAPCPYCDRYTLVAYPRRHIIRCDTTTCRCGVDGCACTKGRPHEWRRDHGHWNILASLLNQRARERKASGS